MTKGVAGLGVDLRDNGGRVVVTRLKEMLPGVPHPAKLAKPPLEEGDVVLAVNGAEYSSFKDCVMRIRSAASAITLTVSRGA